MNVRLPGFHILNLYWDKLSDSNSGCFATIKKQSPIAVLWFLSESVGRKAVLDDAFDESQSAICRYSSRSLFTALSYPGSWNGPWPSLYHLPYIQRDIAPWSQRPSVYANDRRWFLTQDIHPTKVLPPQNEILPLPAEVLRTNMLRFPARTGNPLM
jgi:hypothetical protein